MHRIVIPRLLPALPGGILGEFWPDLEDPADWIQRPQTDPHTQGVSSSCLVPKIPSCKIPHKYFSPNFSGCWWCGIPAGCCRCKHTDGFPGEWGWQLRVQEIPIGRKFAMNWNHYFFTTDFTTKYVELYKFGEIQIWHTCNRFTVCVCCTWDLKHLKKTEVMLLQHCFNCLLTEMHLNLAKHTFFFFFQGSEASKRRIRVTITYHADLD